eukprot:jgi/Chrpa1/22586/Chrysochromulina_OHIO_Genome00022287-RA
MLRLLLVALPLVVALPAFDKQELHALQFEVLSPLHLENAGKTIHPTIYVVINLFTAQGYQPTIHRCPPARPAATHAAQLRSALPLRARGRLCARRGATPLALAIGTQPQLRAVGLDGHRALDISATTSRRDIDTTLTVKSGPVDSGLVIGAMTATASTTAASTPAPPLATDKTLSPPTAVGETPGSSYQLHEDNNASAAAGQGATRDEPLAVRTMRARRPQPAGSAQYGALLAKGTPPCSPNELTAERWYAAISRPQALSGKTTATALTSTATQSDETYSSELATINSKPGLLYQRHKGNASAASSEQVIASSTKWRPRRVLSVAQRPSLSPLAARDLSRLSLNVLASNVPVLVVDPRRAHDPQTSYYVDITISIAVALAA